MLLGPGSSLLLYRPDDRIPLPDCPIYVCNTTSACAVLLLLLGRPNLRLLLPRHLISAGQTLFCKVLNELCTQVCGPSFHSDVGLRLVSRKGN